MLIVAFLIVPTFALAADNLRPNVILIYASDMGKGMISAYGQKQFTTPNIDMLINNGVSFTNAYGCAQSAPARASLMTGYHNCQKNKWRITKGGGFMIDDLAQMASREEFPDAMNLPLKDGDLYLPQVFKKAGYKTAQIGKLGFGYLTTRNIMKSYGWDYYYGYLDHVRAEGYYPPFLFEDDTIVRIGNNTLRNCGRSAEFESKDAYAKRHDMTGKNVYSQHLFIRKTLETIRKYRDDRFFLMLSTQLPGGPVSIPEIHPEIANNENLTSIEKEYASMVKMLDDNIGAILNELRELMLEEKTIIIFASDNGHDINYIQDGRIERPLRNMKTTGKNYFDNIFDKYYSDLAGDVFNGNAGMAGLKRSNLEGGIRIPLIYYWKKHLKKSVCNEIVAAYDFIPTISDLIGVSLDVKKDGISYLPALTKGKKLPKQRYIVVSSDTGPAVIVNDGWKLRYINSRNIYQLYNLKTDPQEKYDISLRKTAKVEELKKILTDACGGNIENGVSNE